MDLALIRSNSEAVVTVGELNRSARALLEQAFPLLWVIGEVSNLKRYDSGHWYFVLKDKDAQVRCVMFRHKNQYLDWRPEDGMQVEVRALVTLYEARGDYQLNVETMRRAGVGRLYEEFERLKARLDKEGLFDSARKRPLPAFPRQVGIVTSPAAAALRDVLITLRRRMPSLPVVLYPAPVQGEGAAQKIAAAIAAAGERAECDVLILCRGGGGIEDLWSFNEEAVARAVAACPIPVVVGVGHETDFTIADFVADQRAPTPTAAAELVSPDAADLLRRVDLLRGRLQRDMARSLEARMQRLDFLSRRLIHPAQRIKARREALTHLRQRLSSAWKHVQGQQEWRVHGIAARLAAARPDLELLLRRQRDLAERLRNAGARSLVTLESELKRLHGHLQHLNPQGVLERGYSITTKPDGSIVRASRELAVGEGVKLTFAVGWAKAGVREKG